MIVMVMMMMMVVIVVVVMKLADVRSHQYLNQKARPNDACADND